MMVSMNVTFNKSFISGASGSCRLFTQAEVERNVGRTDGTTGGDISETAGDITSLTNTSRISHSNSVSPNVADRFTTAKL